MAGATHLGRSSGEVYKDVVKTIHKELEGNLLEDKILSAWMAFIYLQIQNNLRQPIQRIGMQLEDGVKRGSTCTFNTKKEKIERKEMKHTFKGGDKKNRCDYFQRDEGNEDDNNSSVEDDEQAGIIVNYEDEYSTTDSIHSAEPAHLSDST
eukprot:scaffold221418_cov54-Attheya_sp.AAC.4